MQMLSTSYKSKCKDVDTIENYDTLGSAMKITILFRTHERGVASYELDNRPKQ